MKRVILLIRRSSGTSVRLHRPQAGSPFPLFQAIHLQLQLRLRRYEREVRQLMADLAVPAVERRQQLSSSRAWGSMALDQACGEVD